MGKGPVPKILHQDPPQVLRCLTLDLDKLLLGDPEKLKPQLREAPAMLNRVRCPASEVIRRITTVLGDSINRPMTLQRLCKEAGMSPNMLIRKFPALRRRLIRYFRDQRKEEFLAVQRKQLHQAVQFIRERGHEVTLKDVLDAVGDHNHKKGWATKFFAEALRLAASDQLELGLGQ